MEKLLIIEYGMDRKQLPTLLSKGHWADCVNLKMSTFNKTYRSLIRRNFEMPNTSYSNRSEENCHFLQHIRNI